MSLTDFKGYYTLMLGEWEQPDTAIYVVVPEGMPWKKVFRCFFAPIKINILHESVTETEFDDLLALKPDTKNNYLYILDIDAPSFLDSEKYNHFIRANISSDFLLDKSFALQKSAINFNLNDKSFRSSNPEIYDEAQIKIKEVLSVFNKRILPEGFTKHPYILVAIAEDANLSVVESQIKDLNIPEDVRLIVASKYDINPKLFGKNYYKVDVEHLGAYLVNATDFIVFGSFELLELSYSVLKNRELSSTFEKVLFESIYLNGSFEVSSFFDWFAGWVDGYWTQLSHAKFFLKEIKLSDYKDVLYVLSEERSNSYLESHYSDYNIFYIDVKQILVTRKILDNLRGHIDLKVIVQANLSPNISNKILSFLSRNNIDFSYYEPDTFYYKKVIGCPEVVSLDNKGFYNSKSNDFSGLLENYDFGTIPNFKKATKDLIEKYLSCESLLLSEKNDGLILDRDIALDNSVMIIGQKLSDCFDEKIYFNNADVVRIAVLENPARSIIYYPVNTADARLILSLFPTVSILSLHAHPISYFSKISKLYIGASTFGFHALLKGIPVVTFAHNFYAGWGLTDDRVNIVRRKKIGIDQLFYVLNFEYRKYFDPIYKTIIDFPQALSSFIKISNFNKENEILTKQKNEEVEYLNQLKLQQLAVAKKKLILKKAADSESDFPVWYNPYISAPLQKSLDSDKAIFLYIPWIAEHGNTLIARIRSSEYELVPLDFIEDLNQTRRDVFRFARSNPDQYRRMIARRLVPLRNRISGVILTFDWAPVMRIIFGVCEELNIPRILIPHESVFVDRNKYYWDPFAKASRPVADVILGWGGLQRDIFLERGYPKERFLAVGAPKFDPYTNYEPQLSRTQFCRLFGLHADRKIILFASQPLDSQLDHKVARESQRQAVLDLLDFCEENGHQLLMRLPPSKDDILGKPLRDRLTQSEHGAVDDAVCYLVGAEEALYHCDLVTSVNSTMLFEGVLVGRPALSMKYIEFEQIWEGVGIPASHNREETYTLVSSIFSKGWKPTEDQMRWAAEMFSNGAFDGKASERIRQYLESIVNNTAQLELRASPLNRLVNAKASDSAIDLIGVDFTHPEMKKIRGFVGKLFNAADVIDASLAASDISKVSSIDIFLQWAGDQDLIQREVQQALGKQRLIIEDGLLVSDKNSTPFRQKLSISFDDASTWSSVIGIPSHLETVLQSDVTLKRSESTRATKVINKIVESRLSKYNHLPDLSVKIGSVDRPKLLLIDNVSAKDASVKATELQKQFKEMVRDVISSYPDHDILIKTELPKTRYIAANMQMHLPHVYFIDFNIHLYSLFDIVEKVFVVSASEGFEALLLAKEVHCYGTPFYAGWGLTIDHQAIPRRTAKRTVKEIFHFAFIASSRYYLPTEDRACEIEELIHYILDVDM